MKNFKNLQVAGPCKNKDGGKVSTDEAIRRCIDQIPSEEMKRSVILYYIKGVADEEIAIHEGIKHVTVHMRLHKARKKLRQIMLAQLSPEELQF